MTTATNDTLAHWRDRMPPLGTKPHPCPYCKHLYIMPCTEDQHGACINFNHKQRHELSRLTQETSKCSSL